MSASSGRHWTEGILGSAGGYKLCKCGVFSHLQATYCRMCGREGQFGPPKPGFPEIPQKGPSRPDAPQLVAS
jgi:hypothetical protein